MWLVAPVWDSIALEDKESGGWMGKRFMVPREGITMCRGPRTL